jgi:glycosyltransferase involved in cell wall biosynthesis
MACNPRVAFFPDSFHETNGVARTSRALVAAATRRGLPLLTVHAGISTRSVEEDGSAGFEIARGPVSFALEYDLRHDLLLWRYYRRVVDQVRAFGADLVHITGPSDIGQLGACVAHRLNLPLVASWHTNLHEFAACRLERQLEWLPPGARHQLAEWARRGALWATLEFYRSASVLLAPNLDLVEFLRHQTRRPTYLMRRGVDTLLFSPDKRGGDDETFRFGFVGRLSSEKNVRLLPEIERALVDAGETNFRFLIVGDGQERPWLEQQMTHADFAGTLHGEALARAYAAMDLLVFPSETDTFGNVVQEALASGTPALVSNYGGPKFIVRPGVTGFVARDDRGFIEAAEEAMRDRWGNLRMRAAARQQALGSSWDGVLDEVVVAYGAAVEPSHKGGLS